MAIEHPVTSAREAILLTNWRTPGDIVCMTACVRDLALSHPGRYEIHVAGSHPELWAGNPHVENVWGTRPPRGMRKIRLSCRDALLESDIRKRHYITAYHRNLGDQLGVHVPTLIPRGDLHLTPEEQREPVVGGRYWVIVAGGKTDMPAKIWSATKYQQVIDALNARGIRCVQAGALHAGHRHPELSCVEDLQGRTNLLDFLRLVHRADGVLCHVSFPMHVAAAFDKSCVVIAGGCEPWWWAAYTNTPERQFGAECAPVAVPHQYLHSIGQLECCMSTGCWKTHVIPDQYITSTDLCELPDCDASGHPLPRCLGDIGVDAVVSAIFRNDGHLSPCVRR